MGEVYRPGDTNLDRDVVIKVLSEAIAHNAERLARFLRGPGPSPSWNHRNIVE
jgi:hypothetical protein